MPSSLYERQLNPAGLVTKGLICGFAATTQIDLTPRFELEPERQFVTGMIAITKGEIFRATTGATIVGPCLESDRYRHAGIAICFCHIHVL